MFYTREEAKEKIKKIIDANQPIKTGQTLPIRKGLENKNVLIYGNFPIEIPKYRTVNSEERKVLYVAITRAMDKLIILN